jgi:hypothetical protein
MNVLFVCRCGAVAVESGGFLQSLLLNVVGIGGLFWYLVSFRGGMLGESFMEYFELLLFDTLDHGSSGCHVVNGWAS